MTIHYLTDPKYLDIDYFASSQKRSSVPARGVNERIIAWQLGKEYYDGSRSTGYGGFIDDGRWNKLLPTLLNKINTRSCCQITSLLDVGCKKGYIVSAAKRLNIDSIGVENHIYPLAQSDQSVKPFLVLSPYSSLPFCDNSFDISIAFSSLYMQNLGALIDSLNEMKRVSRVQYVTLAAYNEPWELEAFLRWTLLGSTILHTSEWLSLFQQIGFDGFYFFTTPTVLGFSN